MSIIFLFLKNKGLLLTEVEAFGFELGAINPSLSGTASEMTSLRDD
jgi:hypothetical protein